jgi:hypothetical protein
MPGIGLITSNDSGDIIILSDNSIKIEIYRLRNSEKGG